MRATLTIKIDYDDANYTSDEAIESTLLSAVSHLAGNGMLSDEESIVDTWDAEVTFKKIKEASK